MVERLDCRGGRTHFSTLYGSTGSHHFSPFFFLLTPVFFTSTPKIKNKKNLKPHATFCCTHTTGPSCQQPPNAPPTQKPLAVFPPTAHHRCTVHENNTHTRTTRCLNRLDALLGFLGLFVGSAAGSVTQHQSLARIYRSSRGHTQRPLACRQYRNLLHAHLTSTS